MTSDSSQAQTQTQAQHIETFNIRVNGVDLQCRAMGQGPLVLCLHGFPDSAHSYDDLLPVLANAGFRAVAPFLRGYHPSGLAADGDYSMLAVAGDVLGLIDALGEGQADVIGHDWGGFAAYTAANLRPQAFRRLVVMAIPHMAKPGFSWAQMRRSWYVWFFQLPRLPERRVPRDNFRFIDKLYRDWSPSWAASEYDLTPVKQALGRPENLRAAIGYYRAMIRGASREQREVMSRRTQVPCLWLAGEEDGSVGLEQFRQIDEAVDAPLSFHVIRGAGHFVHREAPQQVFQLILDFLAAEH